MRPVAKSTMTQRLLSLLTLLENSLRQTDIVATHPLRATRSVSYQSGLARLVLEQPDGTRWGAAEIQSYRLANGESCIKVALSANGSGHGRNVALFPREDCDWAGEAHKLAEAWLNEVMAAVAPAEFSAATSETAALG